MDDPERLGELGADVAPAGPVAAQEEGEVLGADDRAPRPGDRPDDAAGVDADRDGAVRRGRRAAPARARDSGAARRLDRRHARDARTRPSRSGVAGRVEVRAVRHGEDVARLLVDRLERPVRRGRAVDEVAGRARDRLPSRS